MARPRSDITPEHAQSGFSLEPDVWDATLASKLAGDLDYVAVSSRRGVPMVKRKKNATDGTEATDANQPSPRSHRSPAGFIPAHGGYEKLFSYTKTQIIYDATVRFCDRFINPRSRTHDQMVQAARSGNKNIAEGSRISGTSKESELKLTNVARASLEELLGDYQDYLRQHGHTPWDKNSKEALYVRRLGKKDNLSYADFHEFIETRTPQVVANILICLIHQANYLLDQQLHRLEQDFLKEGGLRERMTRARLAARAHQR
jgi:four helix bundle suffix protein